jgi:hypothetical protein
VAELIQVNRSFFIRRVNIFINVPLEFAVVFFLEEEQYSYVKKDKIIKDKKRGAIRQST